MYCPLVGYERRLGKSIVPAETSSGEGPAWVQAQVVEGRAMSALGHSRSTHSTPVPINVRCYSNSDRSRHECELTLCAISAREEEQIDMVGARRKQSFG